VDKKIVNQLLKKKNVVSVGVGVKQKGGLRTGDQAIVVGVKKKVPLSDLKAQDVIPETIAGVKSDVVEVGEIKALENTARVRPCPGGYSCGNYKITAGTLGAWVKKGDQPMLLSNSHVLGGSAVSGAKTGDAILQPGAYDGGQNPGDEIAELDTFVPIKFINRNIFQIILDWILRRSLPVNKVDCALAAPLEGNVVDNTILGIGTPVGYVGPVLGMEVKKSGRTTGLTSGVISQVDVTARVNMGDGKIAVFTNQFMVQTEGFSAPGDSGSAILTTYNSFVGLLFAGSDNPPLTLGNEWGNVREALKIS
jgi:hypothetical protein